jgi:elongator complex protein 3
MKKQKIFGKNQVVENPQKVKKLLRMICENPPQTFQELEKIKNNFAAQEGIQTQQNRDLMFVANAEKIEIPIVLKSILQKRSVRTISGVSPIGVLTKAWPCPGQCVYCPSEAKMPKSYLSSQPAAARAKRNAFHPFRQMQNRITALTESGHPTSKLEVIVMGGTFNFLPEKYQSWFVKKLFDGANSIGIKDFRPAKNLTQAQKINETATHRIIGLTLETRPDFIDERTCVRFRKFGCTRVEIGVQTIDDEISKLTKRNQKASQVTKAMKILKNFGFKVCMHLMPGLPGSSVGKDVLMIREIFENPKYCPDFVKIYPCLVLPHSELEKWWKKGSFQPMEDAALARFLWKIKSFVPSWVRVMRVLRDVPADKILGGAKLSNLRQILKSQPNKFREVVGADFFDKEVRGKEWPCKCIRCREIGFLSGNKEVVSVLKRRDYEASDGREIFLSFETEDEKSLFALLRLRIPQKYEVTEFPSVLKNSALIREVHSYGAETEVGDHTKDNTQHKGLGKKLLQEAERISKEEFQTKKMTIIAGIGTREYYRKFGYEEKATYMVKKL